MYKSVENVQFDDIMMTKENVYFIKFIENKRNQTPFTFCLQNIKNGNQENTGK